MNDGVSAKTAKPHRVAALVYDGVQLLDVTGPLEVFAEANVFGPSRAYDLATIGVGTKARASSGLTLSCTPFERWRGAIDTLIVPGGTAQGQRRLAEIPGLLRWLEERIARAERVLSVCTGAFVLARLGCFDGRRVTTHWAACTDLQTMAPRARIEADPIYLQDGKFHSSAGVTCGIDLALALVEADHGRTVASRIARNLVLYLRRAGGQRQYSLPLQSQAEGLSALAAVVRYIDEHPDADLSVETLARLAAMSPRHFARVFSARFGVGPGSYVRQQRLERARQLLEEPAASQSRIARRCGFSSAEVMARAFRKRYGVSPDAYRRRFGDGTGAPGVSVSGGSPPSGRD